MSVLPVRLPKSAATRRALEPPPGGFPDVRTIITQDDTPVENIYVGVQRHLLVDTLRHWSGPGQGRPFWAGDDVGVFFKEKTPAVVPDFMVAIDVKFKNALRDPKQRSYFMWIVGKPPDIAIEIVSQDPAGEDSTKKAKYREIGVPYYVVYDPGQFLSDEVLRTWELRRGRHVLVPSNRCERFGLGLTLWTGNYEEMDDRFLRWTDETGKLLPTDVENEAALKKRTRRLKKQVDELETRATSAERDSVEKDARIARLIAKLRDAGMSPNGD